MLIDAADADGDGNIDYEEFGNMLFEKTKKLRNRQPSYRPIPTTQLLRNPSKRAPFFSKDETQTTVVSHGFGEGGRMGTRPSLTTALITAFGVIFVIVNIVLVYIKD